MKITPPELARQQALGPQAYTTGSDVHLSPGAERHLPHEAWHVAQQKQGRVQPIHGLAVNDDRGLEREADAMGDSSFRRP